MGEKEASVHEKVVQGEMRVGLLTWSGSLFDSLNDNGRDPQESGYGICGNIEGFYYYILSNHLDVVVIDYSMFVDFTHLAIVLGHIRSRRYQMGIVVVNLPEKKPVAFQGLMDEIYAVGLTVSTPKDITELKEALGESLIRVRERLFSIDTSV